MEGDGGREKEKTKTPMPPRYMYNCRTDRVRGILTKKGKWEWGGYHSNSQKREERFEKQKKMEMYRSHPRAPLDQADGPIKNETDGVLTLQTHEDFLTVLNQEFQNLILLLHISHFSCKTLGPHDGWRKHHGNVLAGHQVLLLALDHALQVEHEELEHILVNARQLAQIFLQVFDPGGLRSDLARIDDLLIDVERDKRHGQLAEVLLQRGGHGMDIEVRVGNIVILWRALESFPNSLNCRAGAGLPVDTFHIHT